MTPIRASITQKAPITTKRIKMPSRQNQGRQKNKRKTIYFNIFLYFFLVIFIYYGIIAMMTRKKRKQSI